MHKVAITLQQTGEGSADIQLLSVFAPRLNSLAERFEDFYLGGWNWSIGEGSAEYLVQLK
jgi:hypothetical protein